MRRLPRPQRSIDHIIPGSLPPRLSFANSPCRPTACLRVLPTTTAPFSTTPRPLGLFSNPKEKEGKEKHQAFIRKWQKRLLGESEPIGAHVDPYDKTSPIRIAPEEQGEEEELLDEMESSDDWEYTEAQNARGLERIGGKKWTKEWVEWENREKWPQWKDSDSYIPATKVTTPAKLQDAVHRAIVEVLTLRKLGLPVSSISSKVDEFPWIKDVKLQPSSSDELISIHFPSAMAAADLTASLLPMAPPPKSIEPQLEGITEVDDEELVDFSEEEMKSYQDLLDAQTRSETIDKAILESWEAVSDSLHRKRSANLSAPLRPRKTSSETATADKELNLREVPLTDPELKFALVKRLLRLTGLRIPDPALLDIHTFAHLYTQLLIAAKPKPKKLFEEIVQDKKKKQVLKIPNVKFSPRRVTLIDKEKEVGRWKVIEYALTERGIPVTRRKMKEW